MSRRNYKFHHEVTKGHEEEQEKARAKEGTTKYTKHTKKEQKRRKKGRRNHGGHREHGEKRKEKR